MSDTGQSYNEQILQSIIDGEPYVNENPYPSRIELLLMELKTAIEQGGSVIIDTQVNGESTNPVQNRAIYNFVNSSVATNTANFKGTYNSLAELHAVTDATNNDYAFVTGTDSAGNTYFDRYKYNGSEWVFEYELNNSSFTAAQWATIQSGLTAADKTKLDGIEAQANKTVVDSALSSTSENPVQNKAVQAPLARLVDAGTKNLLKNTGTSQTIRNVTFTVNDDGTVLVNGTNDTSSTAVFYLNIVPADTAPNYNGCRLTGCPQGGGSSTYRLVFQLNSGAYSSYASDAGGGSTIHDVPSAECRVAIAVYPGATVDNLTFKPMICTAEDYVISPDFVPYVPTTLELYQMIQALQTTQNGGTT